MVSSAVKCGICRGVDGKYKCPKCGVRYCSLKCYKDAAKHVHKESEQPRAGTEANVEVVNNDKIINSSLAMNKTLKTKAFDDIYQNSAELQELLKYNTVKFHLAKVYRILSSTVNDGSSGKINSDLQKELAVNYLNTLRYGGIHYNEAIEEFCQILLDKLNAVKK
ncbi:Hit1p [Saccharomyces cerevisiae YJM1418]|nr:Hit1p [Saccharomyces cerevisiae YJM1418]